MLIRPTRRELIKYGIGAAAFAGMSKAQVRIPGPGGASASAGGGGITLVSSVVGPVTGGGSGGVSAAIVTTAANFLVLVVNSDSSSWTVTDSYANTWTQAGNFDDQAIYFAQNPTVGTGHTFTVVSSYPTFIVFAFSGMSTSGVYESLFSGAGVSTGGPGGPGSLTPTYAGQNLLIAGAGSANGSDSGAYTVSSPFGNLTGSAFRGGAAYCGWAAYCIQTGTAAQNPQWTDPSAITFSTTQAVFKG
jgi:hypothetical protein